MIGYFQRTNTLSLSASHINWSKVLLGRWGLVLWLKIRGLSSMDALYTLGRLKCGGKTHARTTCRATVPSLGHTSRGCHRDIQLWRPRVWYTLKAGLGDKL